jgi:metal-responsive CopG/Arc/MetJ family transcriptional regulator
MPKTKVAVSLDAKLVSRLDTLVRHARFPNRSQAVEAALEEKLARLDRARLARECSKLDARQERALAEEGMGSELAGWPDY